MEAHGADMGVDMAAIDREVQMITGHRRHGGEDAAWCSCAGTHHEMMRRKTFSWTNHQIIWW